MKNMLNMLKQAQEMKSKFSELKKNIDNTFFFGESIDGLVKVKVNGKGLLVDLTIEYENIKDKSQLESLVKFAYIEAKNQAEQFCESEMNKATGGLPLPFDMKSFL
jgi:DNA-binding YbaB/EbfC family protein